MYNEARTDNRSALVGTSISQERGNLSADLIALYSYGLRRKDLEFENGDEGTRSTVMLRRRRRFVCEGLSCSVFPCQRGLV
jgi:hypothetical protein